MGAAEAGTSTSGGWLSALNRWQRLTLAVALALVAISGVLTAAGSGSVLIFIVAGLTIAVLAVIVGQATEELGQRLGPGATGVLQSALGNLPELFVCIFALRAGLITVVQATIVGSILGNSLLVLGLAFIVGGHRHGPQTFSPGPPRTIATLTLLAVAALAVPTLTHGLHTGAGGHEDALSATCAVVLLVVFVLSVPSSLTGGPPNIQSSDPELRAEAWPSWLAVAVLACAGVCAAFVSDWFVNALTPAISTLHLSQAFTGLVIVAIAGNAVENFVGVQLAHRNKPDYAISVILNSSLQVALGLTPVLVLLSFVLGGVHLTLVLPPLLVAALGLAAMISALIVFDGESTWLEGVALVGLYAMIATSFWWG
jgi:Ca2+:H+ antiporter